MEEEIGLPKAEKRSMQDGAVVKEVGQAGTEGTVARWQVDAQGGGRGGMEGGESTGKFMASRLSKAGLGMLRKRKAQGTDTSRLRLSSLVSASHSGRRRLPGSASQHM